MEPMDLMTTDRTKVIPARAMEAMEILKDIRLCFDRATPNTAAATLRAIMYGTTPFSHSATTFPPCSMNSRGYRLLKGNLSGRRALSEDHFYWLESERSPALASEGVFPG